MQTHEKRNTNRAKTHCPAGHPYTGDNLIETTKLEYRKKLGEHVEVVGRHCRECMNSRRRQP